MTLRRTRKQVGGKSMQHIQSLIKPSFSPCIYSCHSPCTFVYVVISFVLEFDHFGRMRRACMAPTLRQSVRWMDKTAAQFSQTEAPRVAFTFNRKIVFSFIGPDLQIKLVAWIRGQHKPLIIDTYGSQCLPKSEATEALRQVSFGFPGSLFWGAVAALWGCSASGSKCKTGFKSIRKLDRKCNCEG